ncbi:MAG: tetratricopeptide repeat protein [Saprospiraceae bacterium]
MKYRLYVLIFLCHLITGAFGQSPEMGTSTLSINPSASGNEHFSKAVINSSNKVFYLPFGQNNTVRGYDFNGVKILDVSNQFDHAIDIAASEQFLFVLDQKEKEVQVFDIKTGKLVRKIGNALAEKMKKPVSIGLLTSDTLLVLDESKNTIYFFDFLGKNSRSILLNGLVSSKSFETDGYENIYVKDDKLNAILKYKLDGRPTANNKLQLDGKQLNDKKGKIKSFELDPLGYLHLWNESSNELEIYSWKDQPIKILQTSSKENLGLSRADNLSLNPLNYELQVTYEDDKFKSFKITAPVSKPENLFGFDIDGEKLIVAFRKSDRSQANRYGLMTQDVEGNDSLAYISSEKPFIIDETRIYQNRSRRYKLVAMNPSSISEPTTGFDNFFGFANYLRKHDQPEEALISYQNALRYMGRPQKMVTFASTAILDIGKTLLSKNVDLIKGLNALKTAYNLNPRDLSIQKGLGQGFNSLFWRLAAQENYNAIVDEAGKVIDNTFLKPYLMMSIDSLASTLEKLGSITTLTNARLLRTKQVDWAPEQTSIWKSVFNTDMLLYQLKNKSGAPEYELSALVAEAERHIKRAIDLLQKSNRPFINEYIQYLQTLDLSKKSSELEVSARNLIENYSSKIDAVQTMSIREYLASSLAGQKKFDQALTEYNFLLSQRPNEIKYKMGLADVQYANHNPTEALSLYKQLLLSDKDNAAILTKIGITELELGNAAEASIQLEKASRIDPTIKSVFGPLAEAYEITGNLQKSVDHYRLAIQQFMNLNKNSSGIGFKESATKLKYYQDKLAKLYIRLGSFDLAGDIYQKLTLTYPQDATEWFGLGGANLSRGLVYDAVKAYQKALSISPTNSEYQSALQSTMILRTQVSKNEDPLAIAEVHIPDIFPSLYVNYGDAALLPIGDITLTNNTSLPIKYNQITLEIPGIMNEPTVQPGGIITSYSNNSTNLTAILSNKILEYTQGQKLQAKVTLTYTYDEKQRSTVKSIPITINGRNSINWSDKRHIASFIQVGPGIMADYALASNDLFKATTFVPLPDNLAKAMQIYAMLDEEKLVYTPDPDLSYSSASTNTNLLDFLQYPGETLFRKRGDCDDLVTLYCSLIENAGIPTAFIDVPGHIFMAFDLSISPSQIEESGYNQRDVIISEGKVWLPVETTLIGVAPFKDAWETAAKRYNLEINQGHNPELITMSESRKIYRPSVYNPAGAGKPTYEKTKVIKEFTDQAYQIYGKLNEGTLSTLKNQYLYEPYNVFAKNKYAVLLGQSGRLSEAKDILNEAFRLSPANSSLLNNLGNIALQDGNPQEAIKLYEKSYSFDSSDFKTVINLIKAYLKIDDKVNAKKWAEIANALDSRAADYYKKLIIQYK